MVPVLLAAFLMLPASPASGDAGMPDWPPSGMDVQTMRAAKGDGTAAVPSKPIGATSAQISDFLQALSKKMDLSQSHISVIDLRDPAAPGRGGWHDADIVPAASIIKLAMLAQAHHAVAEGTQSWDKSIPISAKNMTGTWAPPNDPYPAITAGSRWSLRDLVEVMIHRSDNVATDTLIDLLGRQNATDFAHQNGFLQTFVRHKLSAGTDVPDPEATGYNQMPPHDAALLLEAVAMGKWSRPRPPAPCSRPGRPDGPGLSPRCCRPGPSTRARPDSSPNRNDAAIVRGPGRLYVLGGLHQPSGRRRLHRPGRQEDTGHRPRSRRLPEPLKISLWTPRSAPYGADRRRNRRTVLCAGKGTPVVFLHGLGASSYSWRHLLPAFSKTNSVYAPDFPGYGRSDKPWDFDYTFTGLAAGWTLS